MVIIEMADGRKIELELYANEAPNTVKNFLYLASKGFYDGLIFHRVIKGFMIQGGCPEGSGTGGPGYGIRGEFSQNGVANKLRHRRGVISMARANHPDSAGSQFFIMHQDGFFLDGQYAAFGSVLTGMDVVDEIAAAATDSHDRPRTEQKIKSITLVDEGPVEEPKKLKAR
jgi:peptidyl-prolyl cis-trans isomerase B (cyclophilin B)